MNLTFLDICAGIGGFRRGMELAGNKCVGFCECDKFAAASYISMHLITEQQRERLAEMPLKLRQKEILKEEYRNGEWYADDIRKVDAGSMPRADCWCFGFPCQDTSIAGKQLGFAGKRSSLFFTITGLIRDTEEENRPALLFIENVKNLLSVNRGLDFARLLIELDEIGYDAEWCLLNSKDFGVPQNRERVFIMGHYRRRSTGKIFPLGEADEVHNSAGADQKKENETACCLMAGSNDKWQGSYIVKQIGNCMPTATRKNPNQGRIYDPSGLAPCLNKMEGGGREPLIPISMTRKQFKVSETAPTLTASGPSKGRGDNSPVPGVLSGIYTGTSKKFQRGPLENMSRCLKSEMHDAGITDGTRIRRFTPKECFRLQGWEDMYYDRAALVNSDSQLYRQAGNGVTVNAVHEIAKKMK